MNSPPLSLALSTAFPQHPRLTCSFWGDHFARRLAHLASEDSPLLPPPHFFAECTPPLEQAVSPLRESLTQFLQSPDDRDPVSTIAPILAEQPLDQVLLLLGQRRTPASLTDERAIPPTYAELFTAANLAASEADRLSVAGRAFTKHAARHPDPWWGSPTGGSEEKNQQAQSILQRILSTPTWWNVFGHYQHQIVFEVRCPEGYGARWGNDGKELIGFLEPFDETKGA
ncbi:MAG: hypothetical protein AAF191_03165 [Verrucomicrobiota bacterium]